MIDNANVSEYNWYNEKDSTPMKGNMVLVRYALNRDGSGHSVRPKARCVWPTSMQHNDSRFLSRRVQPKA